ncbi:MAG: SpoIIE family protein phosphatase [Cytophagales bacterium]|nr:SpoIIE family protein phosphatase [Cytophagales bacterium]
MDKNKNAEENPWPININDIDQARKNYYSLMPDEEDMHDLLPGTFVINKPKENVGGDGFWLYQKEDLLFLAVFDCMGEGHLASMMTRIYANALKKLVVDYKIEFPGAILQFIHREIQGRFKDKTNIQLSTGADLGIVKLDMKEGILEFSGAGMDLLREHDGKIEVMKGENRKIGQLDNNSREYNSKTISGKDKCRYFLATDGVTDLIGGSSLKRLGVENFKIILRNSLKYPAEKRKGKIWSDLMKWSGLKDQNDDILILSFEF